MRKKESAYTAMLDTGGLCTSEVTQRRERFGSNALSKVKRKPFLLKYLEGFGDPIIRILLFALFFNCVFMRGTFDIWETFGIGAAILCATLISALSERGGELAFEKLQREMARCDCVCLRDNKSVRLCVDELVCGDVLYLGAGERVPADGILLEGNLKLSLAALNGEGKEVRRTPQKPFVPSIWDPSDERVLMRGTTVTCGEGKMLVLRVGDQTLYGQMTREVQTETRDSPLRRRLSKLASQMSRIGYCAAAIVAISYLVHAFFIDVGCSWSGTLLLLSDKQFVMSSLLHALMLAVTMIVVAVPEGLPMMISVVLSANIKRMQKDHVLVRKPVGIETAGSMNLLFCDKTGTLTAGHPVVSGIVDAEGKVYPSFSVLKSRSSVLSEHYRISACCNTQSRVIESSSGMIAVGGNATDRAVLESVLSVGLLSELQQEKYKITARVPFDSVKKYSAATVGGKTYIKGAPEIVLSGVKEAIRADGERIPFSKAHLIQQIRNITQRAGRVLALCLEEGDKRVFVSLIWIRDDLRHGAKKAVSHLQSAGIRVVMMTGDNKETAAAIAAEAGILAQGGDGAVITSAELAQMDDTAVKAMIPHLCVVARALPQDKSRLVRLAQELNLTVGMTGDGVNDAPALKLADVGFSLGGGTEVAQEAGDIVILDDNIVSIAKAVLYGRTIFKSIRKFIMFQMTTNLSAVGISVLCPLLGVENPITVLQMLWINLIMDTLGSLAFAGEAPAPDTMLERPKRRDEPIMNRYMVTRIVWMSLYLLGLCLWFLHSEGMREHFSFYETPTRFLGAFFALFVFADICNSVSARTTHIFPFYRLSHNHTFVLIFSGIIAAQLCMLYFGGPVFRTCPLYLSELLLVFLLSGSVLVFSMLVKWILNRRLRGDTV